MLVSFIIPAYNASNYIIRCLDSIYSLPMAADSFEVIVIDDCSTDNTVQVIWEYIHNKVSHSNIHLLLQSVNQRQGAARNRGVSIASGKYIVYVDSDDEIAPGIIAAVTLADEYNHEMVAFHSEKVDESGNITEYRKLPYRREDVFTGIQLQTEHPFWFTGPVAYVYKRDFLDKVHYPYMEGVLFEDSDYVNNHLYHATRMGYVTECGYRVYHNSTSTTHTMSYKHVSDYYLLGTRMLKLYDRIEDKNTKYADTIREGGSYNIWKSFRRLTLLPPNDKMAFYSRIDELSNRKKYYHMQEPAYCWTIWTKIGIKHKYIMLCLSTAGNIALRITKRIKKLCKSK